MANLLSGGNSRIWFSNKPTETGVYRYDVLIDGETVFIGNAFLVANENPIIDIQDIIVNFVPSLHPLTFDATAKTSKLLSEITVTLYLDNTYSQTVNTIMAFQNPYFKSYVSTDILDSWTTNSIGEMPMLQGWDYITKAGKFIPTYPAVPTNVFHFDYIASSEALPKYHSLNVKYEDGKVDSGVKDFSTTNLKMFQITQPLEWLLRGVNTSETRYEDSDQIIKNNGYYSTKRIIDTETNSLWLGFSGYSSSSLTYNGDFRVRIGSKSTVAAYKVEQNGNVKTQYVTIEVTNDNPQYDSSYKLYSEFNSGNSTSVNEFLVYSDVHEQLLKNGSYKLHFRASTWEDRESDPRNPYNFSVYIGLEVTKDIHIPICAAKELSMLIFSPVNSAVKYEQTIAKFDNKSRFFLKWKDRYGMPQCQPFGGTEKYSESLEKGYIINYLNEKKTISISNQPKWILNSKWISQELFPFYESIFVSPWLQLYDAKYDKLYEVNLVSNEYEEKTFYNQGRQLFNLQLEVELNAPQNTLY